MNKKQGVIITTLLVLIVCAGVLATKVNGPLYVNANDTGTSAISLNTTDKKTSKTDFFAESKLTREQQNAKSLQSFKALIDDASVSKESKDAVAKKYANIVTSSSNEGKVETALKSKGFEDVVCMIDEEKVRVIVKGKDALSDQQNRQIKDVVMSITKIKEVEAEVKQ